MSEVGLVFFFSSQRVKGRESGEHERRSMVTALSSFFFLVFFFWFLQRVKGWESGEHVHPGW